MKKNDKLKKIIIIFGIFIIFLIILILIIQNTKTVINSDEVKNELSEEDIEDAETAQYLNSQESITNNTIVLTMEEVQNVTNCIQNYLKLLNVNDDSYFTVQDGKKVRLFTEQEIGEQIYQLLSKKYIEKNNIKSNNVFNYITKLEKDLIFVPIDIKKLENENLDTYVVHGIIENLDDYTLIEEVYTIVNIDKETECFSIEPLKNNYASIDDVKIDELEQEIEEQDFNSYIESSSTNEETIRFYLDVYKELALGDPELAYEILNEEYRNTRFKSLENYKEYVQSNKDNIEKTMFVKYKTTEYDDYTEYVCIDNYGNYYVFKETAPMNYTVILDSYTIEIPEIVEKYNKSTTKEKVGININNIISAINNKDYSYIYEKLDTTFKENNYKTQKDFENYVKQNLYSQNEVDFEEYEDRSGTYIYKVIIKNAEDESQTKNMTIVMQLKEGTDYVMSFSL